MQLFKRFGITVVVMGVLLACSIFMPMYMQDVIYRVVMLSGIAIIMAVTLNLVNGFTGQFSIGHAGFQAVGAYASAALTVYMHNAWFSNLPRDGVMPATLVGLFAGAPAMLCAMLLGGLLSAGIGYIVGLPSLRLRGDYLAIVTLGFGEIIRVIVENTDAVGGPRGFNGEVVGGSKVSIPGVSNFFWVYGVVILVILVAHRLRFSVEGLKYLSVREDEIAAQAMGVDTTKVKVNAFVLGAFFAGVAGALFAHFDQNVQSTSFGFVRSFDFVTMIVLGGLGSITGAVLAAVILTALPEILRNSLTSLGPQFNQYRLVAYAILLIILMLTRPQGIFGRGEFSLGNLLGRRDKEKPPANSLTAG